METTQPDMTFSGWFTATPEQVEELKKLAVQSYDIYLANKPILRISKVEDCPDELFNALAQRIIDILTNDITTSNNSLQGNAEVEKG